MYSLISVDKDCHSVKISSFPNNFSFALCNQSLSTSLITIKHGSIFCHYNYLFCRISCEQNQTICSLMCQPFLFTIILLRLFVVCIFSSILLLNSILQYVDITGSLSTLQLVNTWIIFSLGLFWINCDEQLYTCLFVKSI